MHKLQSFFGLGRKRGIAPALATAALLSVTLLSVVLFSCDDVKPDLEENRSAVSTVHGIVRSGITGGPLSSVVVTLAQDGETVETAETSTDGSYSFSGVEAGAGYTVAASAPIYIESETAAFAVSGTHVKDITLDRDWPSTGTVVATFGFFANCIAFAPDGAIYVTKDYNKILKIVPGGNTAVDYAGTGDEGVDDGSLAEATFNFPYGITVSADGAGVYVADYGGNRIRYITGSQVSTIAGSGNGFDFSGDGGDAKLAQLYNPTGVAVDAAGNIYVVDKHNGRIRKISAAGGAISTIAGGGTQTQDDGDALSASLAYPMGIALDIQGNVYITERHRVRKITGGMISTVFGTTGQKTDMTGFNYPNGIAVDAAGTVYVADTNNNRVVKVTEDGTASVLAGGYGSGNGQFFAPNNLAIGPDGALYIADYGNHRIMKY